ncbi:hypothetical protein, partial [Microvirga sp. KLBC 81]|uniref:hypothetical protein n=1 Tax=Microvirga sp. KLBC 81 TaxID=1862707 RepID=UPI00197CB315
MAGKVNMRPSAKKHTRRYREVVSPRRDARRAEGSDEETTLRQPPRLVPSTTTLLKVVAGSQKLRQPNTMPLRLLRALSQRSICSLARRC